MSRHISRNERWKRDGKEEHYVSEFGEVRKDHSNGNKTWLALVKDGYGLYVCGREFKRARNAMMCVETEYVKRDRNKISLPPIKFPARIF